MTNAKSQCVLNPLHNVLDDSQCTLIQRLEVYDMRFVFERLMKKELCEPREVAALEREFKRFIALAGFGIFPLAMIGPRIDEVWHQFILFTKQYREFCISTVGRFIGHQPDTTTTPVPIVAGENFRTGFRKYFGELPEIWFGGMNPKARKYYLQPVLRTKPPLDWSGWTGLD